MAPKELTDFYALVDETFPIRAAISAEIKIQNFGPAGPRLSYNIYVAHPNGSNHRYVGEGNSPETAIADARRQIESDEKLSGDHAERLDKYADEIAEQKAQEREAENSHRDYQDRSGAHLHR